MFTDPVKNLKALRLRENDIVADLGAGTGYYSIAAGQIVARGKVYAVEIVKDFLATIKNKIAEARLDNVKILWGDIEKIGGTQIGDNIVDAAIASNVLFQVEDKNKFIKEIQRILKPGGRVLLIDWSAGSPGISPKGVLSQNKAQSMFEEQGFILERKIDVGTYHYGMILVKH